LDAAWKPQITSAVEFLLKDSVFNCWGSAEFSALIVSV